MILYHADVSWARAGFLGVDVFFVLSGFLITSLLLNEHGATGRVDLRRFWSRRARRLLPALLLMLVGVAAYARLVAPATELGRIRSDGLASLLYVSNWKFIFDGTSYFQAFRAPSPLAHTWSLAIEEQWYLVWPLALLAMLRVFRAQLRALAAAMLGLALGSALVMALLFRAGTDPSRVYYGTDTRAQALLIGSALAALTAGARPMIRIERGGRPWAWAVAGAASALLLATLIVRVDYTDAFLYRGGFLLVAIASAVLVASAIATGPVRSLLSMRPLRAVGMISYGLYLWHWPVDVVLDSSRTGLTGFPLIGTQVAVTAVIATASYLVVERPIRRYGIGGLHRVRVTRLRRAALPFTTAVVAVVLAACTAGAVAAPDLLAFARAQRVAADPSSTRVLLLGDSQMLTLAFYGGGALDASGPQYALSAIVGCGVFDPGAQAQASCADRAATWRARIRSFDPDLSVLLVGAWEALDFESGGRTFVHGTAAHERALVIIITHALRILTARGGHVALLETPCFGNPSPGDVDGGQRSAPASVSNVNEALRRVAARDPARVTFVPWASAVCPGGRFAASINGLPVRPDGVHFANTAAATLATDRILPRIRELAVRAHAARSRA